MLMSIIKGSGGKGILPTKVPFKLRGSSATQIGDRAAEQFRNAARKILLRIIYVFVAQKFLLKIECHATFAHEFCNFAH